MIGKRLVTAGTPYRGLLVKSVLVMEELPHEGKYFASIQLDRKNECPVLIYSKMGMMPLHR